MYRKGDINTETDKKTNTNTETNIETNIKTNTEMLYTDTETADRIKE